MKLDYGVIIAVVAALLFYFRLIWLQRQRTKRYDEFRNQNRAGVQKPKGKKKKAARPEKSIADQLGFKIDNWYVMGAGIAVLLFGAFMSASPVFTANVRTFWWIPIVIGIFMLNYTIH